MKVISTAPTRLSLVGGGTDLPVYFEKYGGVVLSLAINLRQKIEIETQTNEGKYTLPEKANPSFYSKILSEFDLPPVNLKAEFDAIIESGLGSSASCAVAMVAAINRIKDMGLKKREIAELAWNIEVNKLGLFGGKQDQYAASFGGANIFYFTQNSGVVRQIVDYKKTSYLKEHLLLFYTGSNRKSTKIQEKLKEPSQEQIKNLNEIKKYAHRSIKALEYGNIEELSDYVRISWENKKKANPLVTTDYIDFIYETALQAGAMAGKLMGSGGGGYIFFIVKPQDQKLVIETLTNNGCKHVDFGIDQNGVETRII